MLKFTMARNFEATFMTKKSILIMFICGLVLIYLGGLFFSLLGTFIKMEVKRNLVLQEGKETFDKWKTTPIPVSFTIYLWNCTNPVEVELEGARPYMQEVGPYIFKQMRSKNVLGWDPENMTVTYDDVKTYHFVPEPSEDLDLMIYTLNMPLVGLAEKTKTWNFLQNLALPGIENFLYSYNNTLFVHKKARELLFEGYKVEFLEDVSKLLDPVMTVKSPLPNNTFGYFYGKNNSGDGRFTVFTGEDDIAKYTQILRWNDNEHLLWWNDDYCDMLNGTDGAQFAPPISKEDILYVYTAELCRSVYLEYVEEVTVRDIPAYRFMTPPRLFASPVLNPDNQCYCLRPDYCDVSGILDITSCRQGTPLAITGPHFYQGHERFISLIDGLTPKQDLHETYVDIEPTTGVVLRAARKLQINFLLMPNKNFRSLANIREDMIFPLLWLTEGAAIDEEIAAMFNAKVRSPVTVAKSVLTACIVLGILWILTAAAVMIYLLIKQQKTSGKQIKQAYQAVPIKPFDDPNDPKDKATRI